MERSLAITFALIVMVAACKMPQALGTLQGKVLWVEGNRMPGPGANLPKPTPVKREVLFYEPTSSGQVVGEGSLFSEVSSSLVRKTMSDSSGNFAVKLPPGKYSVFVKEGDKYFASQMDDQHFNPVKIKKDSVSTVEIVINYKAFY